MYLYTDLHHRYPIHKRIDDTSQKEEIHEVRSWLQDRTRQNDNIVYPIGEGLKKIRCHLNFYIIWKLRGDVQTKKKQCNSARCLLTVVSIPSPWFTNVCVACVTVIFFFCTRYPYRHSKVFPLRCSSWYIRVLSSTRRTTFTEKDLLVSE